MLKHGGMVSAFFSLLICLLLTASCNVGPVSQAGGTMQGSPQRAKDKDSFPYTFTDSTEREITLEKKPEKVAVLFSSYADIWTTAGGSVDITVGEAIERGFAKKGTVLVDATGHSSIDLETLVASKPDLVIGTADYEAQVQACQFTSSAGIPSALFKVDSFDDYLGMLKICCDITGNEEGYTTYGLKVSQRIDALMDEIKDYAPSEDAMDILFIRAGSTSKSTKAKTSEDNFACAMLKELKTNNIADSDKVLLDNLSLETIVSENPDYIFITTMGDEASAKAYIKDLFSQNGWKELSAVKSSSYTFLPKELFHYKPNSRWAEAYEYLIKLLYPELKID